MAVDTGFVSVEERQHVAEFALFELHVERGRTVALQPLAARYKTAEATGRPIGAGRLGMNAEGPGVVCRTGRPEVHIRIQEVEQRFRIAEFEIDSAATHVDAGEGRQQFGLEQRRKIPAEVVGTAFYGNIDTREIEAGFVQLNRCE